MHPLTDSGQSKQKHILLVDDEESSQKLRTAILKKHHYAVQVTASIEEARAAWGPGKFDLVLVDLKSNPKYGIDFCSELKAEHPEQLFAVLTNRTYPPPETCPDAIIPKIEGPEYFVREVEALLSSA